MALREFKVRVPFSCIVTVKTRTEQEAKLIGYEIADNNFPMEVADDDDNTYTANFVGVDGPPEVDPINP